MRPLPGPALGVLELESIARGMGVADALLKRARVSLALAEAVTPGKYLLVFSGGVAEVDESFRAGVEAAGPTLLDRLYLSQLAPPLAAGLQGRLSPSLSESVGIVETHSVASALLAADTALKQTEVTLHQLHLARGIGGKGVFSVTGALHMVEEALLVAASAIAPHLLLTTELIAQPHPELGGVVL